MKPKNMGSEKVQGTCQHKDFGFEESAVPQTHMESGFRTFSEGFFTRSHGSGSILERDWLCKVIWSYLEQVEIVL